MRLQRAAILRFTKENILQKRQPQVTCTATTQATEKFFVAKIHRFALSIVDRRTILEKRVSIGYDDRIDCMCIQLIQRQFILLRFFFTRFFQFMSARAHARPKRPNQQQYLRQNRKEV